MDAHRLRRSRALASSAGTTITIVTGSFSSERGFPGGAGHTAPKHGVVWYARTAAAEYAQTGMRMNVVLPGMIDTPRLRGLVSEAVRDLQTGLDMAARAAPAARVASAGTISAPPRGPQSIVVNASVS